MKINRSLAAALFFALATAACSASPTAPAPGDTLNNRTPLLGSGIGG